MLIKNEVDKVALMFLKRVTQITVGSVHHRGSRSERKDNKDTYVWTTDAGCSNRQRAVSSWTRHPNGEKNNATFEPNVSNNGASLHWPPQQNRSPFCLNAFHREPHSTGCHRQEKRHCSIDVLAESVPGKPVSWLCFSRRQRPNWAGNGSCDLQWSGRRPCFFLFHKGVKLVQFCHLRLWGGMRPDVSLGRVALCGLIFRMRAIERWLLPSTYIRKASIRVLDG